MLSLADTIEALKGVRPNWATQIITDASVDSRMVIPGSLFVALHGERVDGHDYVNDAFARGACYALVERQGPENIHTLDLRGDSLLDLDPGCELPVALLVEDSLLALQQVARFWRKGQKQVLVFLWFPRSRHLHRKKIILIPCVPNDILSAVRVSILHLSGNKQCR